MKKYLVVIGLLLAPMLARADGNYTYVLVASTVTNAGYLYPATGLSNTPPVGSFLVTNGNGLFNWSGGVVTSTTAATASLLPSLPSLTIAQINALAPLQVGAIVDCSNCNGSQICISTATNANAWVAVSTGAAAVSKCQ